MASIKLKGDTSGEVTISAPAVAGTTTLTIPAVSGNILTDGQALPAIDGSALTGITTGKVLQVVQTVKTDTWSSTTANSWVDVTGMSVTITPSSSSSKILIIGTINYSGSTNVYGRLLRGATPISVGDAAGSRALSTFSSGYNHTDGNVGKCASINYLDSPSTTSATTYKIQFQMFNSYFMALNRVVADTDSNISARGASTLIAMEIAG